MTRDSQSLQFFVSSVTNDVLTTAAGKGICPKTHPFLGVYVTLRQCIWSSLYISYLRVQVRNNPIQCSIRASQVALLVENLPANTEDLRDMFFSIPFISALSFIISSLLLILSFVCSSFPSPITCKVRLLWRNFSCFMRQTCIDVNF